MNKKSVKTGRKIDKSSLAVYIVTTLFVLGLLGGGLYANFRNRVPRVIDSLPGFEFNATKNLNMKKILKHKVPVMVTFGTEEDYMTQQMLPMLYDLNQALMGKAMIKFVDVGLDQSVTAEFPIATIPTEFFINADGSPYKPVNIQDSNLIIYAEEATGDHYWTAHEGMISKEKILEIFADMGVDISDAIESGESSQK